LITWLAKTANSWIKSNRALYCIPEGIYFFIAGNSLCKAIVPHVKCIACSYSIYSISSHQISFFYLFSI